MTAAALRNLALAATFCAVGVPLAGAPAARAGAGDDAHVVVIDQSVNSGQTGIAAPPCGLAERAVGGGVGFIESQSNWVVSSGPTNQGGNRDVSTGDIPRGWYAAVYNGTGSTINYHFYAICSPSSDVTIETRSILLDSADPGPVASFGENAVPCVAGQVAVGGGVSRVSQPTSSTRVEQGGFLNAGGTTAGTQSGDTPRYWYAAVRNFGTGSAEEYKLAALCSSTSTAKLQVASLYLNTTEVQKNLQCPDGARALSGGAVSPDSNQTFFMNSGPADALGPGPAFGAVPTGWFSFLSYFGSTAAGNTIKFTVVCEAPTPPRATSAGPGATGQRAAALKKCKKKQSRKTRKRCRRKANRLPL
jgi:hypothetical protein